MPIKDRKSEASPASKREGGQEVSVGALPPSADFTADEGEYFNFEI